MPLRHDALRAQRTQKGWQEPPHRHDAHSIHLYPNPRHGALPRALHAVRVGRGGHRISARARPHRVGHLRHHLYRLAHRSRERVDHLLPQNQRARPRQNLHLHDDLHLPVPRHRALVRGWHDAGAGAVHVPVPARLPPLLHARDGGCVVRVRRVDDAQQVQLEAALLPQILDRLFSVAPVSPDCCGLRPKPRGLAPGQSCVRARARLPRARARRHGGDVQSEHALQQELPVPRHDARHDAVHHQAHRRPGRWRRRGWRRGREWRRRRGEHQRIERLPRRQPQALALRPTHRDERHLDRARHLLGHQGAPREPRKPRRQP
mmetsp:Transcript_1300/g.4834  ORF Transcript_1300/g.4834 Transcript_1300/m.4834 type:complete len:319 (-) Transcript_1300:299-1255(-)